MRKDQETMNGNITVELELDTIDHHSVLEGIKWGIVLDEEKEYILENPDVEALFSSTPLPESASSNLHLNPVDTMVIPASQPNELVILTGSVSGEADGDDWYTLADSKVRKSGLTPVTVRLKAQDIVDFCDNVVMEMAKKGECRVAEFRLRGETLAIFVSSGESLWDYFFDSALYSHLTGKR